MARVRVLRAFVLPSWLHLTVIDYVADAPLIIAIDGPSGAGKGTVARADRRRARLPARRQRRDVPRRRLEGARTPASRSTTKQAVAELAERSRIDGDRRTP